MKATLSVMAAHLTVIAFAGWVLAQDPIPDETLPADEAASAAAAEDQVTLEYVDEVLDCLARDCFLGEPEISVEEIIARANEEELEPAGAELLVLKHISLLAAAYAGTGEVDLTLDPDLVERVRVFLITGFDIELGRPVVYLDLVDYFGGEPDEEIPDDEFFVSRWSAAPYLPMETFPADRAPLGAVGSGSGTSPGDHCKCNCEVRYDLPNENVPPSDVPLPSCCIPEWKCTPMMQHLSMACPVFDCEAYCKNPEKYPPEMMALAGDYAYVCGRAGQLAQNGLIDAVAKGFKAARLIRSAYNTVTSARKGMGGSPGRINGLISATRAFSPGGKVFAFNFDDLNLNKPLKEPSMWDFVSDPWDAGLATVAREWDKMLYSQEQVKAMEEDLAAAKKRARESAKKAKAFLERNPNGKYYDPPLTCGMWCGGPGSWKWGKGALQSMADEMMR